MKSVKNKLIVISGPSGAGEDSVIRGLIKGGLDIERVVTTVTRAMRPGESQGKPYYFITKSEFKKMLKEDKLIEDEIVYGNHYGCTYDEIERVKKSGKIGIWKVETGGVETIKRKMPEVVTIYIKPPSLEVAVARLRKRGKDSDEVIQRRTIKMKEYLKPENDKKFDYVIVNYEGKLDETIVKVREIIDKS